MNFTVGLRRWLAVGLIALFMPAAVEAGFEFQIRTFDASNVQTTSFVSGASVSVRIFAVDTAGPNPDFSTQNMNGFTTRILASTTDPNDGAAAQTFNPSFSQGNGASGTNFVTGRSYAASSPPAGFAAPATIELVRFNYTADVPGATTFSFDPNIVQHTLTFSTGPLDGYAPTGFSGATVTVAAVPEPSSLALIGIALGGGYIRYRRRTKTAPK